jgi:hypothetical protein
MENIIDFETFITESKIVESDGIHPAIRQKLVDYIKENPKASYAEARNFISDNIKGWKLSEEDFEEAKKL